MKKQLTHYAIAVFILRFLIYIQKIYQKSEPKARLIVIMSTQNYTEENVLTNYSRMNYF